MMGSVPSKQVNKAAIGDDMANKRPRISRKSVTRPDESPTNSSRAGLDIPRVKVENDNKRDSTVSMIEIPGPSFERLRIYDCDNDGDSVTMADPDAPELIWSDDGLEDSDRRSSLDDDDKGDDNDDVYLVIYEGPYADNIRELRRNEKSRFPVAMMVKLETYRLRMLNNLGRRMSPSTVTPAPRGFAIMHVSDPLDSVDSVNRERERAVVGVTQTLEIANIGAMSYFCRKHHSNMCSLDVRGSSRQNRMKSPFTEVKEYSGIRSFEAFYHAGGAKDSSAWGIDPKGCLGLLAVRGTEYLSMVYVKETSCFA